MERIEPPGPSRIDRVLGAARAASDRAFCARTVDRLPGDVADRLDVDATALAASVRLGDGADGDC